VKRGTVTALLSTLLLAGCGALAPVPEPPMTSSLLDRMPSDLPRAAQRLPATLMVYPPQARQLLDTTQMAFTLRPHHVAYFSRNQWVEPPPHMLHPLLVRAIDATGRFSAVLVPPRIGGAAYGLRSEVLELLQDFSQEPPVLRLVLRLALLDERSNRSLGTREIRLQEPMQEKAPYAGVVAANAAVARALREAADFVLENTP
jgi:cholesterol transport system auxiliary component